jgi:hypothetical protein
VLLVTTWTECTLARDALRGLKIEIERTTVANMLAESGIEPAPERNRNRTGSTL